MSGPIKTVHIHQGDVFATAEPRIISTVLGSCVAVCLFDPMTECGGMNHYVMPTMPPGHAPSARGGDVAISELVSAVIAFGAILPNLRAKVFGGSVPSWTQGESRFAVGLANVRVAHAMLECLGIPVLSHCTGGDNGMRIYFESWTGVVRVRQIDRRVPA